MDNKVGNNLNEPRNVKKEGSTDQRGKNGGRGKCGRQRYLGRQAATETGRKSGGRGAEITQRKSKNGE